MRRYNVNGEVSQIQTFKNEEKCFIYVTNKGEIGVEDIRCKSSALKFNAGQERGIVSSMILQKDKKSIYKFFT